jgi:hypothetical protein
MTGNAGGTSAGVNSALLMTSYVIVLPLFAPRFTELGAGVTALGTSSMRDVTSPEHKARMLGLKSTMGTIASILGPALLVLCMPSFPAKWVFLLATCSVLLAMLLIFVDARGLTRGNIAPSCSLPAKPIDREEPAIRAGYALSTTTSQRRTP